MDKNWGEKEWPHVDHELVSCSILISYVPMFWQLFRKTIFLPKIEYASEMPWNANSDILTDGVGY